MQTDITFDTVRVFFAKEMRAKYISHLDTMRTVTRALKRSELPVWHTQGFNPHIYITFALPISLGYESACESFDFRLTSHVEYDEIVARLRRVLPSGFDVIRADAPVMEPSKINWADYDIRLIYTAGESAEAWEKLETFNNLPTIEAVKKTKKGNTTVDIRPFVENLAQSRDGDNIIMRVRAAAGIALNVNPTLYLKAFYAWSTLTPEGVRVKRTAILDENLHDFC